MYESKYIHNNKTKILDKFPQNTSYFVNFSIQKANISDDNIQPRDVNAAPILVEFSGISLSGAITYISFIFINNIISIIGYFNIDRKFCKNNTSFVFPVISTIILKILLPNTGTSIKNRNSPTKINVIIIAFILLLIILLGAILYISFDVFIIEYAPFDASKKAEKKKTMILNEIP